MSEEKWAMRQGLIYQNLALICMNSLLLPLSKNLQLSERLTSKTQDLDELLTWVRDMVTRCWAADTLSWQPSINHNRDVQYQGCTYNNDALFLLWRTDVRTYGRAYVRTYSQSRDNKNQRLLRATSWYVVIIVWSAALCVLWNWVQFGR